MGEDEEAHFLMRRARVEYIRAPQAAGQVVNGGDDAPPRRRRGRQARRRESPGAP